MMMMMMIIIMMMLIIMMMIVTLLSFMPTRCCMAPEMPTATYSSGAMILPV